MAGEAVHLQLAMPRLLLPWCRSPLQRPEQLQIGPTHRANTPEQPHLLLVELGSPGAQQAEGADGVPAEVISGVLAAVADAKFTAPVLLPEPLR